MNFELLQNIRILRRLPENSKKNIFHMFKTIHRLTNLKKSGTHERLGLPHVFKAAEFDFEVKVKVNLRSKHKILKNTSEYPFYVFLGSPNPNPGTV